MKSNTKMVLGAVSAVLMMIGSVASASDTDEFRGHTGCDRAIEGAQIALSHAESAADLPADNEHRDLRWREAMRYNSACYDVARSLCGSSGGFLYPPAKRDSVRLCQALLDGEYEAAKGETVQRKASTPAGGGGLHMVEMTIHKGFDNSDNAQVHFDVTRCTAEGGSPEDCEAESIYGAVVHIRGGWGSASNVLSCQTKVLTDADPISLGSIDYPGAIPYHKRGKIDTSRLNCTFFMSEPFTVKVVPQVSAQ